MDNINKEKVGLIGIGRFGQLLAQVLEPQFDLTIFDPNYAVSKVFPYINTDFDRIYDAKTIFIAVPIRQFSKIIQDIAQKTKPGTTVIDVCSVKMHPVKIMLQFLSPEVNIIASHPLFGPDSINMFSARKIMMHPVRDLSNTYEFWKAFFLSLNFQILEMTPEQHDESAAKSQNISHFLGRVLDDAGFKTTGMDTSGFENLLKLKEQTCNDSWELFFDLQKYNPYSQQYIQQFIHSVNNIEEKIKEHSNSH